VELDRGQDELLEGAAPAEIDLEGDEKGKDVEADEPGHRPDAEHDEGHAHGEARKPTQNHQNPERVPIERAMRADHRREHWFSETVAVVGHRLAALA
jgi:hypothetical protein